MKKTQFELELRNKVMDLLPILENNNSLEKIGDSLINTVNSENNTVVNIRTYKEYQVYSAVLDYVLSEKEISLKFSKEWVEQQLQKMYHSYLKDANIDNCIEAFSDKLKGNSIKEFFVLSEIENIRLLDSGPFPIVDSTILTLSESDLPFKTDNSIFLTDSFKLIDKPCIFTLVFAGDNEKAKEIALYNFSVSFNLLRLYAPSFKPALKGFLVSGTKSLLLFNISEKTMGFRASKTGDLLLNRACLDNLSYAELKIEGIEDLHQDTPITRIVKECLYWYGLGLEEMHPAANLINFVTILESVLKKKDEKTELIRSISERGAMLLGKNFDLRKEVYTHIKKIYTERSKIVHTGALLDNKNLAQLAGGYARAALISLIKNNARLGGDFNKFIDELDEKKLR